MKLHANAALSVEGPASCGRRVMDGGMVAGGGRRGGRSQRAHARASGCARYRAEGAQGCWIAPRRRASVANRTDEDRVEAIAALRRLRMTGAEIAECWGCRCRRSRGS